MKTYIVKCPKHGAEILSAKDEVDARLEVLRWIGCNIGSVSAIENMVEFNYKSKKDQLLLKAWKGDKIPVV